MGVRRKCAAIVARSGAEQPRCAIELLQACCVGLRWEEQEEGGDASKPAAEGCKVLLTSCFDGGVEIAGKASVVASPLTMLPPLRHYRLPGPPRSELCCSLAWTRLRQRCAESNLLIGLLQRSFGCLNMCCACAIRWPTPRSGTRITQPALSHCSPPLLRPSCSNSPPTTPTCVA